MGSESPRRRGVIHRVIIGALLLAAGVFGLVLGPIVVNAATRADEPQPPAPEVSVAPEPNASAGVGGPAPTQSDEPAGPAEPAAPSDEPAESSQTPEAKAQPADAEPQPIRVLSRVKTKDKVVFLTIDDGIKNPPELERFLRRHDIPVTSFLTTNYLKPEQTQYYASLGTVQNHTMSHPTITRLGWGGQQEQICGASKKIKQTFGSRPWMFRPPYGVYNSETISAADSCGIKYVALWSVTLDGRGLLYQSGNAVRPGDIILTHFADAPIKKVREAVAEIEAKGYRFADLADYWPKGGPPLKSVPAP